MTEYIKLKPTDPESYERRGMYYMDFKDYKNALADFEREIALDSSKVNGYAYAAKITAITKDSKAGEIYFEKAAKVSDIDKEVLNILYAVYLSQQKRYDEAKVKFDVAIRDYQKKLMGDEMNEAGITYTNTKDYLFAIDAFYEAIFAAPKNINFRNNLGALYLLMKDYEQLKGNAENTLAVDNKNKTANSYMSAALKGLGKTKEAIPYEQKSK